MKTFQIPELYRSPVISRIKAYRKEQDKYKKDFSPTELNFGPVTFYIARHFGFCYGVENAIEIIYKIIEEHGDKRIFLLSEMIHNPHVNKDLQENGITFIQDTLGNQLVSWDEIKGDDIVVVPAFGTTVEIQALLENKGVQIERYNTTCPFVEKVWKRSAQLGDTDYTVIIHGKHQHEETRATFSHASQNAHSVVVKNLDESKRLADYILGNLPVESFEEEFAGKISAGFNPEEHLKRVGVVNQTTMLASETQEIADFFKEIMAKAYGDENIEDHFADTRDTLCYATLDNQNAVFGLLEQQADFAVVIGGYNSSNTSHLVDLCASKLPAYHISAASNISSEEIEHFDHTKKEVVRTKDYIPEKSNVKVLVTSGASCPDAHVDDAIETLKNLFEGCRLSNEVLDESLK